MSRSVMLVCMVSAVKLIPFNLSLRFCHVCLRVFLAGHSVAMVTYSVTKIIPTFSPMIGQFFNTMILASADKEW